MFSAHRRFGNCLRINYGHPWTAKTEEALMTLGRLIAANTKGG
jgi:DNA-binding transcriptional MocR family regulator